jgi:hypothetical protein
MTLITVAEVAKRPNHSELDRPSLDLAGRSHRIPSRFEVDQTRTQTELIRLRLRPSAPCTTGAHQLRSRDGRTRGSTLAAARI